MDFLSNANSIHWQGKCLIFAMTALWMAGLIVLPLFSLSVLSFRTPEFVQGGDAFTLQNYFQLFGDDLSRMVFLKTLWSSSLVTSIALVLCYPVAFLIAMLRGSLWSLILLVLLIIPFWVNEVLRAYSWQMLLGYHGAINELLEGIGVVDEPIDFLNKNYGVLLGLTYSYILFMMFPLYNAFSTLDHTHLEAAEDLGAPYWRVHYDIVIPHSKSGIASGCIMTFMLAAGSMIVPQVLGGTRSIWFTQLIYNQFEAINWNTGAAYALSLVFICFTFIALVMRVFRVTLEDISK